MANHFSVDTGGRVEDYVQRLGQTPLFKTKVELHSDEFQANYKEMQNLVTELNGRLEEALWPGSDKACAKHIKEGMLLARERVELLLDDDSPFIELCPLAGWGMKGITAGAGTIAGIGLVCGVECMLSASNPTIKGGASNAMSVKKGIRIAEIALENRLPMIQLVQSAGGDLRDQFNVFHAGGAIFRDLAYRSRQGIPSIAVVFGSSTAGGAYQPGMSDYTVLVKDQAKVYLGGPPLVKMATGEEVSHEDLGGAEMHAKVSGVSDYLAVDEKHALLLTRQIVGSLNHEKITPLPAAYLAGMVEPPLYPADELLGIASADVRVPYDAREVIARLTDGSRFNEFKPLYGPGLVTAFAFICGFPVGVLANNGVLFNAEANKGTQFIHLCNQRKTPIVFLANITGFMVGQKYEREGMIKQGALMINAVTNSAVPAITIQMGASYGAGNYAMSGRAYHPRFIFAWPQSKCSVMGPDQLTGVMEMVQRQSAANAGKKVDESVWEKSRAKLHAQVENEGNVYYTSSRLIDDAIIDPRDTRDVLGVCLSAIHSGEVRSREHIGVCRM
ncbi:hypothetical protein CYMTET_13391 [Cymbomonas tetramitiformis]|uniref:methylcrotonoyl-CoA carboxylase n=1 Tax=Cymbomonas tetramitiformis TaxID=36881 RepID=A0AAE0GI88_9CHLO|nr:hypothetical protein CYMTET_13391 [Cymbomonas tetramitiformis]